MVSMFFVRCVCKLLTTETLQLEAETLSCETTTQGTVHFLRGRGGWWDFGGGHRKKKTALKGGHLKKLRVKEGPRKILPLLEGGVVGKNLVTGWGGGVMQLSNDTSKNSTSPPYLVKNVRSPTQYIYARLLFRKADQNICAK